MLLPPIEPWPALGCLCLSIVQANLPGAGLVTHRRVVQVLWREVTEPQRPTALSKTRTIENLLSSSHQISIYVTAEWAASPVDTRPLASHW